MRVLLKIQVAVLALGTAFAWVTLAVDYRRFFAAGGRALEFSGCAVANPIATPCFYGAFAFLVAFLWAVAILRAAPEGVEQKERGLRLLLAAGTLFAWGNFGYEVYRFARPQAESAGFSCPPGETVGNPLLAPCFYGALIFLTALIVSMLIRRAHRRGAA